MSKDAGTSRGPKGPFRMSKDAGPSRGPKGPFTMRTRSKTAPAGTVRKHFSGKFARKGRLSNIERATPGGAVRKHFSQRMSNIERDDGGNIVHRRRVSPAAMPRTDSETGRKRSSASDSTDSSQTGLSQMAAPTPKRRRTNRSVADGQVTEADNFCWLCHREGRVICCELCPRVFHTKCLGIEAEPMGTWVCPECQKIMRAECVDTCSKAMSMITCDQLCVLLKYAVQRMKHQGSEPFQKPVDMASLPTYRDYIVHPVDLGLIEKNIRRKVYGSTEALLAEVKWILHNCIIFNGLHHKLTTSAKMVVKICRHEMTEIEICPDCYTNSCTKRNDNWFCVPCRTPHTLVWAKMKGYPFWPAKALREVDGQVDVRFFGEHDRAWVPMNQVYLLSRIPPVEMKNTRGGYRQSMDEVQRHISRLKEKFGSFHYASYRTSYNQKKPRAAGTLAIKDEFGGKQISETKSTVDRIIAMDTTVPSGSSVVGKNTHAKGSVKRGSELSIVSKTASAVKSKYNSIITTRRAKEMAAGSDSGSVQVQAVRTGSLQGKGRLNRAEVSESCGSGFEMSDVSILHSEVTRFRPLVTLTRISPDMLQPLSGQSTVRKIEDTIKKRDALKADADRETGADHLEDESSTEQMEQAPVTDAKQSSGQKDESGTEQMEQEQPAVNEAKEQPTVAAVAATDIVSLKVCGVDESTGGENAASATPCETDSNTASYKKNKFLESLVETCKAKLGVNADEPSSGAGDATSSGSSSSSSDSSHSSEGSDSHCEKEAGEKEAGEKKAGEKEAGEKEAGEKEAGEKEAREKKAGEKEAGEKEAGEKEAGEKEAGEKEAGEKKAGEKEAREKKAGEKEAGEKGEPKESDKENANKDGHTTSVDATSDNVGINNTATDAPAKVCNKKKDAESECIITSSVEAADNKPHEIGSKKTIESDDEKAAVTPSVDKVKHDTMNNQPSAKCDGSKSKTNEINENKNLKLMKPDSPGLEMEVDSISDSESESNVSHVVIDIDKEPGCHGKEMTINVDRSANDDNAFVIDLDKDDDQKHDVKASAAPIGGAGACGTIPEVQRVKECVITVTNKSGLMGSKKPVKFKSERQKEIERQQRHMMSMVKSSHSATLTPLSTNHLPAVKLSSSFPEVGVGLPTQPHIIPDDDIDDVDGILDDVMSEKRLKESVEKMDVSKYSDRLMMSVRSTLQDMYYDLVNTEATKAVKRTFQLELDKIMWQHRQQLAELKHNANLTLAEMRASLECDKQKVVKDLRQKLEAEKIIAINDTKKKQWCAYCSKEANFYCCWNTSYCDYPCQQAAWPEHMSKCTQTRTGAPQAETSSGGISVAGAETKPELARHTNIGQRQADELHKDHQMALSYTFGGTQNAAGGMNSAGPFASTLQPPTNLQNVQQPLQSVAQMPLQLRYPGTAPHFQQQYAPIAPGQMVGHGGMPGQSGGPMLYSAVLRQPPSHTAGHMAGMTMGQNPGQLMMAPGTNLHRGPMSYRPPQGY